MKCAIVTLTRGYKAVHQYTQLVERNAAIYTHFNQHRLAGQQVPLILFHEGNIGAEHQQWILSQEQNDTVMFINVAAEFNRTFPPSAPIKGRGYRQMCRFYSIAIWKYLQQLELDWVWRIDEDCVLLKDVHPDVFAQCQDRGVAYASALSRETHEPTNRTLPLFLEKYLKEHHPHPPDTQLGTKHRVEDLYDHKFPYTNVFLSRVDFWLLPEAQRFLQVRLCWWVGRQAAARVRTGCCDQ
jgi:hypothetical protein